MVPSPPIPIRFSPEDRAILDDLTKRTGLTIPGVLRLAIREMRDRYEAASPMKKTTKKRATKKGAKS